jgi:hypothetical protein
MIFLKGKITQKRVRKSPHIGHFFKRQLVIRSIFFEKNI